MALPLTGYTECVHTVNDEDLLQRKELAPDNIASNGSDACRYCQKLVNTRKVSFSANTLCICLHYHMEVGLTLIEGFKMESAAVKLSSTGNLRGC